MNYKQKYLKYKQKYLNLKKQIITNFHVDKIIQSGGNKKIIIHISGSSGAGKTTLGKKLKNKFKNKIVVADIDDIRADFINQTYGKNFNWDFFDSKKYQKFIDDFINYQKKPIVFVGLNHMFWHNKKLYYNLHSNHNFFIELNDETIIKQKCLRFITNELQDIIKNKNVVNDITQNNKKFVKLVQEDIERNCGTKETLKINKMWIKDYKKQNYIFDTRENIYKSTIKILQALL